MSISISNVDHFRYTGGLIGIGSDDQASATTTSLVNLGNISASTSQTLTATGPDGDGRINLGETFVVTSASGNVILTLKGTGTYSALLTGTQTVMIAVDGSGTQYSAQW
ncbi:MAG: hypothetical protein ACK5LJ_03570 [Paracoccus sp. (in: a-proteobacteria)]